MVSPIVYVVVVVVGFIVLLILFAKLGDRLPKPRPSQSHKTIEGYSHRGEDRNEIYTEAGLVHLEYTSRTDSESAGALGGTNSSSYPNDGVSGELNCFALVIRSSPFLLLLNLVFTKTF